MKFTLLAVLFAFAAAATPNIEPLPVFRGGAWTFQSATILAPFNVVQAMDDYPPCDVVEDFCNHLCADTRNELGCFMNCMWSNSCPVGLVQNKAPEKVTSSYSELASHLR